MRAQDVLQVCANCAHAIDAPVAPLVLVRPDQPIKRFCSWRCLRYYAGSMARRAH
jgi:hypothetical protein